MNRVVNDAVLVEIRKACKRSLDHLYVCDAWL